MSPGGGGGHAGGLDALLLGFSSSNGESSPQHSGPGAARDSGAGLAFPSFGGDDLHFIQVGQLRAPWPKSQPVKARYASF